jgi:chromosomal replication initiator protein
LSFSAGASAAQVWEAILGQLLLRVTRQNYDTWLRHTVGLRFEGTTLLVSTPNDLASDWLSTRLRSIIAQAVTTVAGPGLQIRFESNEPPAQDRPDSAPLQPALIPAPSAPLNPRFRFNSLLVGDFNRLAVTAAQELASTAGSVYSPLFITGASGSGKTHLLHAIAHEAFSYGVRVLLVNAEQFLSEYTTALRNKTGASFRARYRDLDLLLVDDVDVLLGKKATLNEFYRTLANLNDQGKRIVVTGDISALAANSGRFQGTLRWGLVVSIETLPTEERIRFVDAKARAAAIQLPSQVEQYLALRVKSSIRDLEGAVNRVTALARISREPITIDFVAQALQPVSVAPAIEKPQPSEILEAVCQYFEVELANLRSESRSHDVTRIRHIAMYLLREDGGLTFAAIAQLLNRKDHSTVVHACKQLHKEQASSSALRADIDGIRSTLLHLSTPS